MKRLFTTLLIGTAALALWAQAPPENAGAVKGKGKTDSAAKGKGKGDAKTAPPAPPVIPQVLRLIRPSMYLVTGHGTNSVFRVTKQGVFLVNTKSAGPGDYERLTELIRGITPQTVKFVFNTGANPESSGNNPKFQAAGAELVTGERIMKLDSVEARTISFGDSTAVYFPTDKVICLGDLYTSGSAEALDTILKLDWMLAVPASGEPIYRSAVETLRKSLR